MKALSYICPNIEKLFFLDVERDSFEYEDVEFVQISKFVLGLNFKNLSSLSLLRKFDMEDGSFLLSVISLPLLSYSYYSRGFLTSRTIYLDNQAVS